MIILDVDEAGDTGVLRPSETKVQPLFCILGLATPEAAIGPLTDEFLELKLKYFPNRCGGTGRLGRLLVEIEGADVRRAFRENDKDKQAHHLKFMDCILAMLEAH